jgi:hypothetical protein
MPAENSFSYKRTLKPIPIMEVHFSLLRAKSLCLAGVRSRYNNGSNDSTSNTFTIKVTKAGILDRKYDLIQGGKKATARGWRPFGVILSGSQIIFFADISSFQNWLANEEKSINSAPPRRNNSFPAFSSLATQQETCSNLSVNATTTNSMSSLNSTLTTIPIIPTSTTSTSTSTTTNAQQPNTLLRPVQIVSLSYAICIVDEEYTKYPHVFRLITGDGQQFLLRAENDEEMEDWMLKINYAATLKTTGVRMRPTKRPTSNDKLKREEEAKEKVDELSDRIDEQVKLLDRELQLRRNLMVLIPYQKSTKDRVISFAETLGKRIKSKRIELQRLECYRDYLESELTWCLNTNSSQSTRKLSLPLPPSNQRHLYSFTSANTTQSEKEQQQEQQNAKTLPIGGVGRKESVKKLSNLVFTASPPTNGSSPISNITSTSSSSTSSSASDNNNVSSAISGEEAQEEEQDDDDAVVVVDKISSISMTNSSKATPQLPAFSFPKSFTESLSFMDSTNIKSASDKAVEMDRIMRRRSQSNPILPRGVDKKLLFLEPPTSGLNANRQRSGSEASSVRDDDDMSVIIVNDSVELLSAEPEEEEEEELESSWSNTSTTTVLSSS